MTSGLPVLSDVAVPVAMSRPPLWPMLQCRRYFPDDGAGTLGSNLKYLQIQGHNGRVVHGQGAWSRASGDTWPINRSACGSTSSGLRHSGSDGNRKATSESHSPRQGKMMTPTRVTRPGSVMKMAAPSVNSGHEILRLWQQRE